jgi:hypothetical protein
MKKLLEGLVGTLIIATRPELFARRLLVIQNVLITLIGSLLPLNELAQRARTNTLKYLGMRPLKLLLMLLKLQQKNMGLKLYGPICMGVQWG